MAEEKQEEKNLSIVADEVADKVTDEAEKEPEPVKMDFDDIQAFVKFANGRIAVNTKIGIAIATKIKKQFAKGVDRHRAKEFRPYREALAMKASVYTEGEKKGCIIEEVSGTNPKTGENYFRKLYTPKAEEELIRLHEKITEKLEDHVYDIKPHLLSAEDLPDDLSSEEIAAFTGLLMTPDTAGALLDKLQKKEVEAKKSEEGK